MDRKVQKEIEERMGVLQATLKKAKALVAENEDHLEESWIWEEEACQGDHSPLALLKAKRQSPLWRLTWMTSRH